MSAPHYNFADLFELAVDRIPDRVALIDDQRQVTYGELEERCNALVYAQDGPNYVLVASNGGSDDPPGWLFNVREKPEAEIQIERRRIPVTARVLERGDADYDRLWRLVNDNNHARYDAYQTQTARPIPLVLASPVSGG